MGLAPIAMGALRLSTTVGRGLLTGGRVAGRFAGRAAKGIGLFGAGAASMFLGGLSNRGSDQLQPTSSGADGNVAGDALSSATQVSAGAAVGSGAAINVPALVTPKAAKKVSNPSISTLNESVVRLTSIAVAIADNLKEQQNILKAQIETSADLARESALEKGGAAPVATPVATGDTNGDVAAALDRLEDSSKDQSSSLSGLITGVLGSLGIASLLKRFFRTQNAAAEAAKRAALVSRAAGMVGRAFRVGAALSAANDIRKGNVVRGALTAATVAPTNPFVTVPSLITAALGSFDDYADKAAAAGAAAETVAGRQVVTREGPGIFSWATTFGVEQGMQDKNGQFVKYGQWPELAQAIWAVRSAQGRGGTASTRDVNLYNRDLQRTARVEALMRDNNFTWEELFQAAETNPERATSSMRQAAAGVNPNPLVGGNPSFSEIRAAALSEIDKQGGSDEEKKQRAVAAGLVAPTNSMSWDQLATVKGVTPEERVAASERLTPTSAGSMVQQRGLDFSDLQRQPIDTSYYANRAQTPTDITPDDFRLQQNQLMIPQQASFPTGPGSTPAPVSVSASGELSVGNVPDPTYHGISDYASHMYFEPSIRTAA